MGELVGLSSGAIENLSGMRRRGFDLARRTEGDKFRSVSIVRRPGLRSTSVMVSATTDIEFRELRDGQTSVVSHSVPREGTHYVAQGETVFVNPLTSIIPSCEVLGGPCVSDSRSIGALHLGRDRLVARAQREEVLLGV